MDRGNTNICWRHSHSDSWMHAADVCCNDETNLLFSVCNLHYFQREQKPNGLNDYVSIPDSIDCCVRSTATIPWMTGTAVNPLLRAIYLERRREQHSVTLCIPWIEPDEQVNVSNICMKETRRTRQDKSMKAFLEIHFDICAEVVIKISNVDAPTLQCDQVKAHHSLISYLCKISITSS